ncbi:hypothetical protein jhhlp_007839 [Lomentospora prolificans]|uniref:Cyclin-dependent kinase n=1 Tax=Lomentospora prolificans TaxID=41688 RepID=A0A2N3N0Q9_9PEZI|nr:hypothetical protein jhhlp_007839 [Lomentospora prolificans]
MHREHSYPPSPTVLPSKLNGGDMGFNQEKHSSMPVTAPATESSQCSSQESQLFQLSRIAAMQEKLDDRDAAPSKKRTADGKVKAQDISVITSPIRMGHSRNNSTVSIASTTGSRIGELTSELKTRLSYAMVKVNHGWQGHSIDEVESLASRADSSSSSSSTLPKRRGSSASPALSNGPLRSINNVTPPASQSQSPYEPSWPDSSRRPFDSPRANDASKPRGGLAPPAPIQPGQTVGSLYGNSKPTYTPTLLSQSHTASPRTPIQGSPYISLSQPTPRTRPVDPILYSPHQNIRDQDAIEALISMSSPGNSAHLKAAFSPAASPNPSITRTPSGRHALPTGQPRKSLPSGRPVLNHKRVGFEKSASMAAMGSPNDMEIDVDSPILGSPHVSVARGTPRRRMNGNGTVPTLRPSLSLPAALGAGVVEERPRLRDDEIEKMLERAAQDDSDDDEEILLPVNSRRSHSGVVGSQ